jgi:alginate O-acetyltransferase complex protein AlgI
MLFTNAAFAFIYLPIVWAAFFVLGRYSSQRNAAAWLFFASVAFYGYWMPEFTVLLIGSIGWNFWVSLRIVDAMSRGEGGGKQKAQLFLKIGIILDLVLLGYFKYANFFIDSLSSVLGQHWQFATVILPIGISFFTFTQIAFLVDTFQKGVREVAFVHYGLFVTYFPHLIAGPVLHHAQMMPQFREAKTYRLDVGNIATGLAVFAMGLFKKIIIADGISPYADAVFNAAEWGATPSFNEAWLAALAYSFQLYFDFSGYSDMAVGLSWLFNVRLPYNFNSPYQAANIIDFWRRWHISLSSFLRDYLYIPLGGNRKGRVRRHANLFATMLLGGLWHGASWSFVFWGGLHGAYLIANHAVQATVGVRWRENRLYKFFAWLITLLAVLVAWVFFRATSFSTATHLVAAMFTPGAAYSLDTIHPLLWNQGLRPDTGLLWCGLCAGLAFFPFNSNQMGESVMQICRRQGHYGPVIMGAALTLGVLLVVINGLRTSVSAFIYFNF